MSGPTGRALMGGTAYISVGLAVAGGGTVSMLAVAARALTPRAYAAFAVWWTTATLLGIVFGVFEAFLSRLVVGELVAGRPLQPLVGQVVARAGLVAAAMAVSCLAAAPVLSAQLFQHRLGLVGLLPLYFVLAAAQAVQRGAAVGTGRFRAVGVQFAVDGSLRAAVSLALLVVGERSPVAFALATCLAAAGGLAAASALGATWWAGPRWRGPASSFTPVALLLFGAAGPVLANSGSAPWLAAFGDRSPTTIGAFVGALTLSRLPTQFVAAAFGPLLTGLSHAVEAADPSGFRRLQRKADRATAAVCLVFVLGFGLLGPWVLPLYLGPSFRLPRLTLFLLAAASGIMLSAVVRQAGLAARERWSAIAWAWTAGGVALATVFVLPVDALLRAASAPVAAVLVALAALVWASTPHRFDREELPHP